MERETNPAGVREHKRRAARQAIGEAAMTLALERGFDEVRVDDIAQAAGISPRTFSNYFSSKQEAVVSVASARAVTLCEHVRARPAAEDLWEALAAAFESMFPTDANWQRQAELVRRTPELVAEQLRVHAAIEHDLAEEIARRCTDGTTARDLYPRLAASAVVAAVRVISDYHLEVGFDDSFVPTVRTTFKRIGVGLGPSSGFRRGVR